MKKFFLILSVIFFEQSVIFSQDKIVLLDQTNFRGKVVELNTRNVIYKKAGRQRLFEIEKNRVWYVSYKDGKFDSINSFRLLEKTAKIHLGCIPYQLLGRSSGMYFQYSFNRLFSIEYRPTYTYETRVLGAAYWGISRCDWFFYQGINNNILVSLSYSRNWKFALMFGYKYWWLRNEWIPEEGGSTGGKEFINQRKSNTLWGPVVGFEFERDISTDHSDFVFFINPSFTFLTGTTTVYEERLNHDGPIISTGNYYPQTTKLYVPNFNLAVGFKVGYRK